MRVMLISTLLLAVFDVSAYPTVGNVNADGDVTLLSTYEIPVERKEEFESAVRASATADNARHDAVWLTYEEFDDSSPSSSLRYFTVHFPDNVDQLTEPSSAVFEVVSRLGNYRIEAELTRQVPDWCSTTNLDAGKLQYAYAEYLWLLPGNLDNAGKILAKRGEILRSIYGTTSDGNAATEGFVAMVAPFQVMYVLFSAEDSFERATALLRRDLNAHGYLVEWDLLGRDLDSLIAKRKSRSGQYRPTLSADR